MLELKKGADILAEVGGIQTLDQAQALFAAQVRCGQPDQAVGNRQPGGTAQDRQRDRDDRIRTPSLSTPVRTQTSRRFAR